MTLVREPSEKCFFPEKHDASSDVIGENGRVVNVGYWVSSRHASLVAVKRDPVAIEQWILRVGEWWLAESIEFDARTVEERFDRSSVGSRCHYLLL